MLSNVSSYYRFRRLNKFLADWNWEVTINSSGIRGSVSLVEIQICLIFTFGRLKFGISTIASTMLISNVSFN